METATSRMILIAALVVYILAVSFIGYANRANKSPEEYFLANRQLPTWLLAITFIASWWGGGSAIDLVDQANREGLSTFWIYGVPVLLSTFLMFLFSGGIRRIGAISQPQLIARRYDGRSELMLTIFIVIFMTIGSAIQIIVIGHFFQSFLSMSYTQGAALGALLVVVYSYFGGFKGVVLTDLFQFVFFLFSSLFLFWLAYENSGGFGALEGYVAEKEILGFNDFFYNLENNLAYIITFGTSWMVQANVWQRISAAKNPASAKGMMAISFFVFIPLYLIVTLTGMLSRVNFETVPEHGIVSSLLLGLDQPILSGIVFIGLCSAIMSTMDSMFNTGSLTLTLDLYKRYIKPSASERQLVGVGRFSTLLIALVAFFIAVRIESVLTISWIGADFIATGAFVPIVLGFLWRGATATAAFVTMLFGLIFSSYNMAAALGLNVPIFWEIASAKQALVGILCSLLIFVLTSFLTKGNKEKARRFISDAGIFS